jgi:hypothetical protein
MVTSEHLITLCKDGEFKQLVSELQQPVTAQVALSSEEVVIDPDTLVRQLQFNLHRMLKAAARAGNADTIEQLLKFGQQHGVAEWHLADPDVIGAALCHENAPQVLLKFHTIEPNVFARRLHLGMSILGAACDGGPNSERPPRKKFLGLVRHLMELGFDPNTTDPTAPDYPGHHLYIACWMTGCEVVECLLDHGAVITGSKAALVAAEYGRIDVLEALLWHGLNLNECFTEDSRSSAGTALHVAVASRQVATVEWLLQHGTDINLHNINRETAGDLLPADADEALSSLLRPDGARGSSPK